MNRDRGNHAVQYNLSLAIPAIVLAVLALSADDSVIKFVGAGFSLWQTYIMRSALAVPVLLVFLFWQQPYSPVIGSG